MKNRGPYCLKCNDTRLITAVFDKGLWFFVPEDEAKNYELRGRTETCPDCRFAGEPLELPVITAK